MPTYEVSPEFLDLHARLTPENKRLFRVAVGKMVDDLRSGRGFRPGLRVKPVRSLPPGFFEMTWAPDGRGIFAYGAEVIAGETHIVWHVIGTHAVLG